MQQYHRYGTAQDEFDQEYLQNVLGAQPVQPAAPAAQPIAQVVSPDVAAPFVEPDYGQMMFGSGQDASLGNTPLGIGRSAAVDALLGGGWSNSTDFEQYVTSGNGQDVYTGPMVGRDNPDYVPFDVSQASGKAQQRISPTQYAEQSYGPGGKLAGDVVIKDYPKENPIFGLLINAGMAGVLGPLAGTLGAAVNTGLGLGLGTAGSTALGAGLVSAGKTAGGGGDLGDVLKSGLTGGATSYLGSAIGNVLPKDVAPTGIKSLDTALTKGMQSAAGSGVTSLLTGNKNILQDALMAGAGAAAGSGVNSAIGDAAGSTGLPPAALNILGPAAIASLTGGDGTTAALKAAIGELGGAIKGSVAEGKQTGPGVTATRDLLSGIIEPGEYPQDDGSVISVARLEKGPNKGKLVGNVFSKEEVLREAYQDWSKQPAYVPPSDPTGKFEDAEDFTILPDEFEPSSGSSDQVLQNAGLVQKDAAITEQAPVEITGQTPDTELMRFLEANGLTSDEAQKVLITGKDQGAGTDYNKFFELGPEGTPTPKVVVQGQTPPKDTAVDDLMALLNQYDPKLDNTQRVDITGNTPKEGVSTDLPSAFVEPTTDDTQEASRVEITAKKLLQDMGLDLGAYNEGPIVAPDKLTDTKTQTVPITGTKVKEELDPNFFYQPDEVAPDKLTDDLTQEVEITGKTPPITLPDYSSLENVPEEFPFIYPGEETPPEVNEPVVDPTKPVVKPVIPKVPGVTPPGTTTTPGSSYTIPGTTTQLHQELMQLPETDISRLLNPAFYAYKDAQKRKKPSGDDQMMALLNELGYRS